MKEIKLREVKYRGIAQGSNEFIYGLPGISGADGSNVIDLIDGEYIYFETLGQSIGIENIFQGDILKDCVGKYVVGWDTRQAKFNLMIIYDEDCEGIRQTHKNMPTDAFLLETIGNIHQDKNLLK